MLGLWLENGRLRLRDDLPKPDPGAGEALVAVRLAGVCGTDLALLQGYGSFTGVPGHEFVGEIVQAAGGFQAGTRVVGRINVVCRQCEACLAGAGQHCRNRTALGIRGRDGAFAEYLTLPLENLLPVPEDVSDDEAVFVEPLAAAFRIPEQVELSPATNALVVGAGRLGQLVARVLASTGCSVVVVTRRPSQRVALRGVAAAAVSEEEAPRAAADLVVDATGSPSGFRLARRAVRPGGAIVLKSAFQGVAEVDLSSLAVDEIRLIGSRCGPFEPALESLRSGDIDPRPLIHRRFPLEAAVEAFRVAGRPGVLKVLIGPGQGALEEQPG